MKNNTIILIAVALAIPGSFALGHWSAKRSANPEDGEQANAHSESMKRDTRRSQFSSTGTSAGEARNLRRLSTEGNGLGAGSGAAIETLAEEAFSDPSELKRSLAFSKILESLTPENAQAAMEAMRTHGAGGDEWELFRYAWATVDPAAAMEYATSLENRGRRDAISDTLTGWASVNPEEAIAWVDQLEDEEDKSRFRRGLIDGMADHDIASATSYVLGLAAQGDKDAGRYLESLAGEKLRSGNIQDAVMWSESLGRGALAENAMERVASRYVDQDPEAAAAWVAQYATDEIGPELIEEVSDEWAERDPEATVAWLSNLPEGRSQEEGIRSALGEWARRDLTAAGEYLNSMAPSATRDAAVSGYAENVAREDPEGAVAWANSIGQEELRVETLERTARDWYRRDPEAAEAWLGGSGLPAESQGRITSRRDGRGRRD